MFTSTPFSLSARGMQPHALDREGGSGSDLGRFFPVHCSSQLSTVDFKFLAEAPVSPAVNLRFHAEAYVSLAVEFKFLSEAHVSLALDFGFRSEARVSHVVDS